MEIIIPIHSIDKENTKLLSKAIDSINLKKQTVKVVCPEAIESKVLKILTGKGLTDENMVVNHEETSFESQVNYAVSKCKTKYFSILEFDDTYHEKWFDNVEKYITYYPSVSAFIPLCNLYDSKNGNFLGYANELALTNGFADEVGVITNEMLLAYPNFFPQGGVFKTEDFKNIGGFKKSIKFGNWYEFLLRLTFNGKELQVIPKSGHNHIVNREGSYYDVCDKTMGPKEQKAWLDLAVKEHFFNNDRDKQPVIEEEPKEEK